MDLRNSYFSLDLTTVIYIYGQLWLFSNITFTLISFKSLGTFVFVKGYCIEILLELQKKLSKLFSIPHDLLKMKYALILIVFKGKQVVSDKTGKLSKKTIVWVAVGLVVGSILIIIVIVFIVNSVRSRYSDLVFNKNMKNNNDLLNNMKRKHSETITFIPRNGRVILQPEIV